jgi:Tol biopolymer transport system component
VRPIRNPIDALRVALAVALALPGFAAPAQAAFSGANGKIVFARNRLLNGSNAYHLYTMNPDGSTQTDLTFGGGQDLEPAWSADGERIAFISSRDNPAFEVYAASADGGAQTRMTFNQAGDSEPVWSPDDTKIAFDTNRDGNDEI